MSRHTDMEADRLAMYLAHRHPAPKCRCNFCGLIVPPKALWCSTSCAQEFAAEKAELLARDGR